MTPVDDDLAQPWSGARQGGVRVVGWPPWILDQGQWPPWIWAMFRFFYKVIFPVHKQGSIESPPRKQRLENDAKEREKQTIVAKNQLVGLIMQALIGAHCKKFTGSRAYIASFIRCGADNLDGNAPVFLGTYVPRYPCSPVPMFPGTCVPRTYVPR